MHTHLFLGINSAGYQNLDAETDIELHTGESELDEHIQDLERSSEQALPHQVGSTYSREVSLCRTTSAFQLLIIDDMLRWMQKSPTARSLLQRVSSHCNCSVVITSQGVVDRESQLSLLLDK